MMYNFIKIIIINEYLETRMAHMPAYECHRLARP